MGPNWADILEAFGTVGAFAVGLFLFRREFGRDRDRDRERVRSQATRVYAWVAFDSFVMLPANSPGAIRVWSELSREPDDLHPVTSEGVNSGRKTGTVFVTCVTNSSDGPIYEVKAPIGRTIQFSELDRTVLLPGESFRVYWLDSTISATDQVAGPERVAFNDAASVSWHRTETGELVQLKKGARPVWVRNTQTRTEGGTL